MASPSSLISSLRKVLSPRSPFMRLKSPFKFKRGGAGRTPGTSKRCTQPSHRLLVPGYPNVCKKLFNEDTSPVSLQVPQSRHVLDLESNIGNLLDNGIDEKKFYVLGKGSFGTVILSYIKGKKAAVKIVKTDVDESTMARERNALILSHPNVVDVLQIIQNTQKPFGIVVMEPWSPLTLQSIVDESLHVSFEDSIRIITGISIALEYCHEVGIAHLDVKPKNILIDINEMTSKLCDFGNSYNMKCPAALQPFHGTVAYIAPELFREKEVTEKCDVYSFGITMWQILHKEYPYVSLEDHAIIYQVVAKQQRPKTTIKPEAKGFIKLYEKCWQEDPFERPTMFNVTNSLQTMF